MSNTLFIAFFGIIGISIVLIFRSLFNTNRENKPPPSEITTQYGRRQFPDFAQTRPKRPQTIIKDYEGNKGYVPLQLELEFSYTNAEDEASRRRVSVHSVKVFNNNAWIRGYCHLRNEGRTFRIDRMADCINIETGEILDDPINHIRQEIEARSVKKTIRRTRTR